MFDDQQPKDIFAETDDAGAPPNLPTGSPAKGPEPVEGQPAAPTPAAPVAPPSAPAAPAPTPAAMPSAPQTPTAQPSAPTPGVPTGRTLPSAPKKSGGGLLKAFLAVVAVILVIGVALFIAYTLIIQSPAEDDEIIGAVEGNGVIDEDGGSLMPEPTPTPTPEPDPEPVDIDSDGDGLNDADEADAGTDPSNQDSDADGLGDREEVMTYGTDPLDADTDNDGFLDGAEVRDGYNPNGDGKLFEVPQDPK